MTPRRGKYNAKPVDADGYHFDSQAEYDRWCVLRIMERAGHIAITRVHPKFEVIEGFKHGGRKVRPTYYEADFEYRDLHTGELIVEDVKGVRTPVFNLKEKLLLSRYPHINFKVVEA